MQIDALGWRGEVGKGGELERLGQIMHTCCARCTSNCLCLCRCLLPFHPRIPFLFLLCCPTAVSLYVRFQSFRFTFHCSLTKPPPRPPSPFDGGTPFLHCPYLWWLAKQLEYDFCNFRMNSTKKLNLTTLQNCKVFNTFGGALLLGGCVYVCVCTREMAVDVERGVSELPPVMLVNLCGSQWVKSLRFFASALLVTLSPPPSYLSLFLQLHWLPLPLTLNITLSLSLSLSHSRACKHFKLF